MLTKEEALVANEFHLGECKRIVGKRGGITEEIVRYRRNGKTQTWKRNEKRFRIPVKYGLYLYGSITEQEVRDFHTAENCPLCKLPTAAATADSSTTGNPPSPSPVPPVLSGS